MKTVIFTIVALATMIASDYWELDRSVTFVMGVFYGLVIAAIDRTSELKD